ncbi:hypothetical protein [uncultured Rubinisphaera sp.]|uniref:hypothetical protein n=1 Tax=uncultured Rubinisphaera sp. TaxID=1678686 RepID=UPI0030DA8C8D
MLILGTDQHARQLTISLRDQQGDVLLARQVSTRPAKILQFFDNSPSAVLSTMNCPSLSSKSAGSTTG